jgi:hypothetical protein
VPSTRHRAEGEHAASVLHDHARTPALLAPSPSAFQPSA